MVSVVWASMLVLVVMVHVVMEFAQVVAAALSGVGVESEVVSGMGVDAVPLLHFYFTHFVVNKKNFNISIFISASKHTPTHVKL